MLDPFQLVHTIIADRYLVEEVVGEGGFSIVYRATHLVWKRAVAIKVFNAKGVVSTAEREVLGSAFVREGALLSELSEHSTAICQARDTATHVTASGEPVLYMVLEWLAGESLETVLLREREGHVPPRSMGEVVRLFEPVVEGLAYAHRRNIAHRDVKPANLFVIGDPRSETCSLKLLDFGIANVRADDPRPSLNGEGTSTFTPAYGAPEQFAPLYGPTGPWTDVFALGLLIVELVTGKSALSGASIRELGTQSTNAARRPTPRALGTTVSDAVELVLATALAVEPIDRFLSAGEFWSALDEARRAPSAANYFWPASSSVLRGSRGR
ncbi:MAG: serine/threonine-protein kinase [Polyangiaceae bacterium]